MIAGIFHQGSGLGNQLHRYVAIRVLAEDKGYEWGMTYQAGDPNKPAGFKGTFFLEQPRTVAIAGEWKEWHEKKVTENGLDIRSYDPEFNFIEDKTVIDGEFQDPRYFEHHLDDIREWLAVEPIERTLDNLNTCVIGFRGGEYSVYPDLFLTKEYWDTAIKMMLEINPLMRFEVHTDDVALAQTFFPNYPVIHDIGVNWRSVRYAKYLIIANSSFFIFPALLGSAEKIIAPRYWARRNIQTWAMPSNYYKRFHYI